MISPIRDFLASRRTGVGSSDIPVLCGLEKRYGRTPLTLWRQKLGLDPETDAGPRAEWGHRLEGAILAKFIEDHYGEDIGASYASAKLLGRSYGDFWTNTEARRDDRPYCIAHADLVVDTADGLVIVEAKSSGLMAARDDFDDPGKGYNPDDLSQNGIPTRVFLQVQWQLYVYGAKIAYVAALIDTGDYRPYGPIIADPRTQEKCLPVAQRFWECVEKKEEPKPETWSDIELLFPETQDLTARIGGEEEMRARAMIAEYHAIKKRGKADAERLADIKDALGIYIGENSALTTAEGVKLASSWGVTMDYAKLSEIAKRYPEEYAKYKAEGLVNTQTRRELRPAKIKGGE